MAKTKLEKQTAALEKRLNAYRKLLESFTAQTDPDKKRDLAIAVRQSEVEIRALEECVYGYRATSYTPAAWPDGFPTDAIFVSTSTPYRPARHMRRRWYVEGD